MNRITDKNLQAVADRINHVTGSPSASWVSNTDGRFRSQKGNFHISHAYGGVSLYRMVTDGGGVSDVFSCGHTTKRDLLARMQAYLEGASLL